MGSLHAVGGYEHPQVARPQALLPSFAQWLPDTSERPGRAFSSPIAMGSYTATSMDEWCLYVP